MDHGPLFQPQDETEVDYQYVEDTGEPFVRRQTPSADHSGTRLSALLFSAILLTPPARSSTVSGASFSRPMAMRPSFEQLFEALGRLDLTDSSLSADTELDDFGELGEDLLQRLA